MKPFLKSGATILLTPDPGWHWVGWDGRLTVYSAIKPLHLSGDNIIIGTDVPLFTLISIRAYAADWFSDIPGTIALATFAVDEPTLSDKIKVNRSEPLLISTTGTFSCSFTTPSFKVAHTLVPDTQFLKHGTWKVVVPNQQVFFRNQIGPEIPPCVEEEVPKMTNWQKRKAAMMQSHVGRAVMEELKELAEPENIAIAVGVGLAAIALLPAEGVAAVFVAAGALFSGIEMGKGLAYLVDFNNKAENAQTCRDISEAADSFSKGAAQLGIGGIGAILSLGGLKMMPKIPKTEAIFNSESIEASAAVLGEESMAVAAETEAITPEMGFDASSFADEIIAFNKTTDGGGHLISGTPSSAIDSAMYYETAPEQGAAIFRSISRNHMFMNGNKRTAVAAFQSFAKQHGLNTVGQEQMMDIATQVINDKVTDVSQIAKMLIK
ncbi:Fic family protein [Taibaiella koreensis]|uniref:Fic family protein n=1 Tax=Taibaiella koreensis TaxID=1268548 RepID=UPI000E59C82E|nr:Fic family protein [Taibaiella koreensis]